MDFSEENVKRIAFRIGGFFSGVKRRVISLEGDMVCHIRDEYSELYPDMKEPLNEIPKPVFLDKLRSLHMGDWKKYYDSDILDGIQWDMEIIFNDGTKRKYGGSNNYPPNFDLLLEIMGMEGSI